VNCRACGGDRLTLVFEMDPMPLAGAFAVSRQEALDAERYPIEWHRCRDCGLVNVAPDVPDDLIYRHYSYRASDVPALVRHHEAFAAWLVERFPDTRRMLEVGGNDGVLLRHLPFRLLVNVDPSDAATDGHPWATLNMPIEKYRPAIQFDLITSSNAFAHFTGIGEALMVVRAALKQDGHFVMEVHDLDATLASGQWDTVYHEHKVEWSLPSLSAVGAMCGLRLIHHERLPLHGGLLRAVFVKDTPRRPTPPPAPDFRPLVTKYRSRRAVGATAAYGAAARATVYLNQVPEPVEFVVDGSPRRQGRFVPGTGTPIVSPAQFDGFPDDRVLITAWNHADDIKAAHPEFRGEWVTAW
jgi:SAM-dependent methyltransferase